MKLYLMCNFWLSASFKHSRKQYKQSLIAAFLPSVSLRFVPFSSQKLYRQSSLLHARASLNFFTTTPGITTPVFSFPWFVGLRSSKTTMEKLVVSTLDEIPAVAQGRPLIGTHNNRFHCDEVLGVVLLMALPQYKEGIIVRSRNPEILERCNVVLDVGNEFDLQRDRYDHHQRTFSEYFDSNHTVTFLSSAGLIYKYHGKSVLKHMFGLKDASLRDWCYEQLYKRFIESIDANDNGISICDEAVKYIVTTTLPDRVARLNSPWNKKTCEMDQNEQFKKAMSLVGMELREQVKQLVEVLWPARGLVEAAIQRRWDVHTSGQILELSTPCPFQGFVREKEKAFIEAQPEFSFALYKTVEEPFVWHLRTLSKEDNSFSARMPLPEAFCGLRDEELEAIAGKEGLKDLLFIHKAGFLAITKTKEAALRLFEYTQAKHPVSK